MKWNWQSCPAARAPSPTLIVPSPALHNPHPCMLEYFGRLTPLPVNRFPNKLAPNVPNNMLRNSLFCSFASYWNVSQLVSSINQVLQEIWCFSWYPPFLQSKLLTIFGLLSPKDAHLIQRISFEYLLCCYYC